MVLIKNFRTEFYEKIRSQRILVLVSLDVDAVCALRIIQYLFQCDHVKYTILPVAGKEDLAQAFDENKESCKVVLMINCGGNFDVVEFLQPMDDIQFFICDSHRPIHVHNIYNTKQVQMVIKDDLVGVPEFDDIFCEESSDEEDSVDEDGEPIQKRQRMTEEKLLKRREKRIWEEKRAQILLEYSEFTTHGNSASVTMFELAWKMTKDTNDLLWLATIGLTDQFIHQRISREQYIESISLLQPHVSRHNHRIDDEENKKSIISLKVHFEEELQLCLYRHWTLFDSLCNSPLTASKFKVWTMKGKKRLHEFLADMGLSLVQCKQMYTSMDSTLRSGLRDMIESRAEKYGLQTQEILVPTFLAECGYRKCLSAMDAAYACSALLESVDKHKSISDCFLDSQDCLQRDSGILEKGIDFAKTQLKAIMSQVQSFLDMSQIISAGPFLYAFVSEGTPDVQLFSKPICLQRLAKFTLTAYCAVSKSRRAPNLPLILGAPKDLEQGTTLLIGIPPLSEEDGRNFFGQAFKHAAHNTESRLIQDSFDSHIAEMMSEDKSKFFDALIALMQ